MYITSCFILHPSSSRVFALRGKLYRPWASLFSSFLLDLATRSHIWRWETVRVRLGNCIKWFLLVSFPLIVSSISCSFIGCLLYITVSFWVLINVSFYLFGLQDCKSVCVCGECGVCALRALYKSSLNFPQLSILSLFC